MKKILALVVAFALVFTCISGCFTTAAEEAAATPSISVVGVEVEASATEAGVVVKGENFDDLAAQNLVIDFDDNLTVTVPETWAEVGTAGDVVYTVDTETNTYKLISWNATEAGGVSEFTFTFDVSFLANETELEVVYNVDLVSVDAGSYDAEASIKDIALNDGTVTQKANKPEHVHAAAEGAEWIYDATNHWHVCAEHSDVVVDQAEHEFTSETIVAATDTASGILRSTCACGYSKDDVIEATGETPYITYGVTLSDGSTGNTLSLESTGYTFNYQFTSEFTSIVSAANKNGNTNRKVTTVLSIDGTEFVLNPWASVNTKNFVEVTGFSLDQFVQEAHIFIRVTWTDVEGATQSVDSNAVAVTPHSGVVNDSVFAEKYLAYQTLWASIYA